MRKWGKTLLHQFQKYMAYRICNLTLTYKAHMQITLSLLSLIYSHPLSSTFSNKQPTNCSIHYSPEINIMDTMVISLCPLCSWSL